MKKQIICMGNSYKNGGRCLAGIEVKRDFNGRLSVVENINGSPRWIRPVNGDGNCGLPEFLVGSYEIFDILEIDITGIVPTGAHSENVHFSSIRKVGRLNRVNYSLLCDNNHNLLFGDRGNAITTDQFELCDYSLMFIKPENPIINTQINEYGHEKFRIVFTYNGVRYDLPLTDTDYIRLLQQNRRQRGERTTGELFFTVSLGVNFHDMHYKLIAGVIDLAA